MKTPILICTIIISLTFVACGHNTDTREFKYEIAASGGSSLTGAEKSQVSEEALIERLQAIIKELDNVNEAVIDIGSPNETEKDIEVLIVTEPNKPLTDEQKTGIINIIKDSIRDDFTVTVDLKEEQYAD